MIELYDRVTQAVVGRHVEIKSILAAMEAGKHILLEGPPGTSKSTLLRRISREAGIPFHIVEGNIDLTPAKLVGHFNPGQVMADTYQPEYFEKGPLTQAMEAGGILYIEEFNRMPADVSNVLISPMEEGEMFIPRYGTVRAVRPFTVIAAQNPYDDVGTVRVSRAFMDRICLIKTDYQSEEEEREVVRQRTGCDDPELVELSVQFVRRTREHPDIKLGASIRAAIDLVDLYSGLRRLDASEEDLLIAARMAISNKIWLKEMSAKAPEEIIDDIWRGLRPRYASTLGAPAGPAASPPGEATASGDAAEEEEEKKKRKPPGGRGVPQ
ncbi:MAG: MoxR family ATPase [Deferrisomatales bacterium]